MGNDGLRALRVMCHRRFELDRKELDAIHDARGEGATWADVADALGLGSPQAAQQRRDRLLDRLDRGVDHDTNAYPRQNPPDDAVGPIPPGPGPTPSGIPCAYCGKPITGRWMAAAPRLVDRTVTEFFHADTGPYSPYGTKMATCATYGALAESAPQGPGITRPYPPGGHIPACYEGRT